MEIPMQPTTQSPQSHNPLHATATAARHTLDTLAAMSFAELEALYRAAPAPASMKHADGALRGRMLAIKGVERGLRGRFVRRFAASRSFVWEGKTFKATDDARGHGHNRIAVKNVLGRQNLFPFETRIDRSEIDARPTLVLDYELAVNPPYIRKVHDEIRELAPGLFLGPAMWKTRKGPVTVLWFALDGRAS
jgi:hypothetical protein